MTAVTRCRWSILSRPQNQHVGQAIQDFTSVESHRVVMAFPPEWDEVVEVRAAGVAGLAGGVDRAAVCEVPQIDDLPVRWNPLRCPVAASAERGLAGSVAIATDWVRPTTEEAIERLDLAEWVIKAHRVQTAPVPEIHVVAKHSAQLEHGLG